MHVSKPRANGSTIFMWFGLTFSYVLDVTFIAETPGIKVQPVVKLWIVCVLGQCFLHYDVFASRTLGFNA